MKHRGALQLLLLPLIACGAPVHAQLTGAATAIPASMFGTFDLTMIGATARSPYPDETTAKLTIAIDGALCAPGLRIEQPFMKAGDASTLYWSDADVGLEFSLDVSGAFRGFGIGSANGTPYGTLTGEHADATDPCDYHSRFFELAEANYPELFPESLFVLTRLTPTSFYRHYSSTGVFLGIANDVAFARGGPYPGTVVLGDVSRLVAGGVDELVVPRSEPVVFPAILEGTYAVSFTSAGPFAPIPAGTTYDLALGADGELCLDGVMLHSPYPDPGDPDVVYWGSQSAGFILQLDLGASTGTALQMRMLSDEGLLLGTLNGTRSGMLADCAGLVGGNIDLNAANALFLVAEQVHPELFPASALTYNRFDGTSLVRFYPASDVLVTVTGSELYLSGGPYGSELLRMGTVDELARMLETRMPGFVPYAVAITGEVVVEIANLPQIDRRVVRKEAPVPLPVGTDTATLSAHMQQLLREELKGASTFTFRNVVATATTLSFDVDIRNSSQIVATEMNRAYSLRVVYTKQ
ncbi:MAG: hypothetical protein ACO1PZ_10500 [Gammaproteobacteria bacterium]